MHVYYIMIKCSQKFWVVYVRYRFIPEQCVQTRENCWKFIVARIKAGTIDYPFYWWLIWRQIQRDNKTLWPAARQKTSACVCYMTCMAPNCQQMKSNPRRIFTKYQWWARAGIFWLEPSRAELGHFNFRAETELNQNFSHVFPKFFLLSEVWIMILINFIIIYLNFCVFKGE